MDGPASSRIPAYYRTSPGRLLVGLYAPRSGWRALMVVEDHGGSVGPVISVYADNFSALAIEALAETRSALMQLQMEHRPDAEPPTMDEVELALREEGLQSIEAVEEGLRRSRAAARG